MDITARLRGKRVAAVLCNGATLNLRMENGDDICIEWVDDNGVPIKGRPVIRSYGGRLDARSLQYLIRTPNTLRN
jgi:hypothetical protein